MEGVLPPTDSRLRPDIRAMENGDIGRMCDTVGVCGSTLCHTGLKYQLWCYSCFYMDALLRSGKCREEKT